MRGGKKVQKNTKQKVRKQKDRLRKGSSIRKEWKKVEKRMDAPRIERGTVCRAR